MTHPGATTSRPTLMLGVALAAALLFALGAPAFAHSYKFGNIEVGHLWAPPPAAGATATNVYGPMMNVGKADDRLLSVTSTLAQKVEFRTGKEEAAAGVSIDLASGKPVSLASWGVHLRLIGLKHPLKVQDWVPIHMVFERAGEHDAKVLVETQPGH